MKEDFEDIFHEEEYSELVNRYEEMLKNNTSYFFDVSEFESIIDYYIDSNKANNALNVVKFAAQQHPNSLSIQLKKAQVLVDKGHAAPALQIINQLEKVESSNSDVYLLKGSTLNIMGRYSEAERAFDTAIIYSYEDKAEVIHTIAQSFEQIGRYKTALKYLHEAYKLDSKNIMLLFDIGYCYEKLGQINKSIEFYIQYIDKEPFSENAWYNLGILYNKFEKFPEAIEAYEYALAINPNFSVAYFNLANAYSNYEDFHNAILNYKEYLKFDGKSVEILTFIGDCYESLKEFDLALKYYDDALIIDEYYADSYFGKANVMFRLEKFELALPLIEKAIVIDDINPEYLYLNGNILNELNKDQEALNAFKKAHDLSPEEMDFAFSLSESYVRIKKIDLAINILSEYLKDNTRNALVYYRLSGCYFLKNEKDKALMLFEKGLKIDPKDYLEIIMLYPDAIEDSKVNELLNKYSFEE